MLQEQRDVGLSLKDPCLSFQNIMLSCLKENKSKEQCQVFSDLYTQCKQDNYGVYNFK